MVNRIEIFFTMDHQLWAMDKTNKTMIAIDNKLISDEVLEQRREHAVDCSSWPRHEQFFYDGASLDGKSVLVRFYHGLGDAIMVSRFLPRLRMRARKVTAWISTPLIELLRQIGGVDEFLPLHDGSPVASRDVDIESMELIH